VIDHIFFGLNFFFRLEKSCGTRWDWLHAIQSARACAKKRQKTEGESENEARSLEEGKRVRGILVCRTLSCLVSLSILLCCHFAEFSNSSNRGIVMAVCFIKRRLMICRMTLCLNDDLWICLRYCL
jgi:hypothetical protein